MQQINLHQPVVRRRQGSLSAQSAATALLTIALALMGMDQPINLWLAWAYVGLRVLHSIVQSTVNIVAIRFPIFALASLCLLGLTVHAGARILHDCLGWHVFMH